jgi:hypothetical protein
MELLIYGEFRATKKLCLLSSKTGAPDAGHVNMLALFRARRRFGSLFRAASDCFEAAIEYAASN